MDLSSFSRLRVVSRVTDVMTPYLECDGIILLEMTALSIRLVKIEHKLNRTNYGNDLII